jgi:hypothetical protein
LRRRTTVPKQLTLISFISGNPTGRWRCAFIITAPSQISAIPLSITNVQPQAEARVSRPLRQTTIHFVVGTPVSSRQTAGSNPREVFYAHRKKTINPMPINYEIQAALKSK